jgi:hypothetical protein
VPRSGPTPWAAREDLNDTQPIGIGDRWSSRRARPQRPRRRPADQERAGQPGPWAQPQAAPGWRPLPAAGREPGQPVPPTGPASGPAPRRGHHLMFWVFTLLVAVGIGATAVLGPWAEPLNLSPQGTTLGVIVASLVAWVLLSALLRLAGIVAFVLTPLLYLAGNVPELRRLPFDLPVVSGTQTVLAMSLGLVSWLAGHWFHYARKGWWRSRAAGALLGSVPGVESTTRRPAQPHDYHGAG